jgi:hypothetical protein
MFRVLAVLLGLVYLPGALLMAAAYHRRLLAASPLAGRLSGAQTAAHAALAGVDRRAPPCARGRRRSLAPPGRRAGVADPGRGADELAQDYAWASAVEHLCNLWLIMLLAAFRQPGSTLLALLVAACLLYLGVAARRTLSVCS